MKEAEIRDYLLIGDLHSSALVSNKGSIDWLCLPHFDSPSIFAKILDKNKGGSFSLENKGFKSKSKYIKNTAITETIFYNKDKEFIIKDFMLPQPTIKTNSHYLIRKLKSTKRNNKLVFYYNPQPKYALKIPIIEKISNTLRMNIDSGELILHFPENSKVEKSAIGYKLTISLKKGQTKEFIIEFYKKEKRNYKKSSLEKKTRKFWKNWVKKGDYFNFHKEQIIRSAITLKLTQFYPTGALIASPTTSLPESIGGKRNWDYRYVWVRDATFTLFAFYKLGYFEEARKFFHYIEKTSRNNKEGKINLELFYTIDGNLPQREQILSHLSGYKNSKPVRIGNDAIRQFQLDVYGTLIDSYYFMISKGLRVSKGDKEIILELVNKIEKKWKNRDSGIWEFRGMSNHYTYSKVMAWVGINRALRLCKKLNIKSKNKKRLEKLEKEITEYIWKYCFNKKLQTFVQSPGVKHQDSTNLLFVLLQFLDKDDPITKKIITITRKELSKSYLYVYRYINNDNIKGKEGAFILCTFWLISALALTGEVKEAEKLFNKAEKIMESHGLISEEIDPQNKEFLGNFPQSFSHMGHIMSAYYINKYKSRIL